MHEVEIAREHGGAGGNVLKGGDGGVVHFLEEDVGRTDGGVGDVRTCCVEGDAVDVGSNHFPQLLGWEDDLAFGEVVEIKDVDRHFVVCRGVVMHGELVAPGGNGEQGEEHA